jgi:enamine deaminase RidA (YjgF/YER057c/UK114 family)
MATQQMESEARQAIWPSGVPRPLAPYSPVIKAGGWVFVAGQLASDFVTGLAPEARPNPGNPFTQDPQELQARYVLKNLAATLQAAGCDIAHDVVRIYQWFTSPYPTPEEFEQGITWPRISITPYLRTLYGEFIGEHKPASTAMGIRRLLVRGTELEVDMIAVVPQPGVIRQNFSVPDGVPAPLAGYSPGVRYGDWVFLAGEIPVDWQGDYLRSEDLGEKSGLAPEARVNPYFWYGVPIEKQTDYVLQKLSRIAQSCGTSLDRCVKATVYIGHPKDYAGMDRVWREWFPKNPPARVVIPFCGLGGKGSRVEIAMKLLASDSKLSIETIETPEAPEPIGHEPQAVKAGNFLFFSTQIAADRNGVAAETVRHPEFPFYGQPARQQVRYIMKNVAAICEKAGTSIDNICRRQCFHDDFTWFAESMDEWRSHFSKDLPASTTIELGGPLLVPGCHVLLDLIAYVPPK